MDAHPSKAEITALARSLGASAVGFCRVGDLVETIHPEIRETARSLPYAVSIGIAVQKTVLATIKNHPNEIYKSQYKMINSQLDQITYELSQYLEGHGLAALPIPASKVLNRYPMIGHVNHREFARKAGLGWWGNNNLLVSPHFGARLRLATILTDCEFVPDAVLEDSCGQCRACKKLCPAGAIGDSRDEFDLERCRDQVIHFSRDNNYGHLICGICLNCCPQDNEVAHVH